MSVAAVAARDVRLDPELRRAYLDLVERHAGLRLTDHQARNLDDLVSHLVAESTYAGPGELYAALLAGGRRHLIDDLAARLTVGETHFFRVGPQIEALRRIVLPEIISRHAARCEFRAWSAGCSTGEEPYTLAILLREQLPVPDAWDIRLLATDINQPALEVARRATYGGWSFRGTPDEIRQRYFRQEGGRWTLVESVRRMVQFTHLNLLADPVSSVQPGSSLPSLTSDLDLILCRNVTIYFGPDAVQRVYRRFAEALVDGGWLVLGPSDPTPSQPIPLEPVYLSGSVLWRRRTATSGERATPPALDRQPAQATALVAPAAPVASAAPRPAIQPRATIPRQPTPSPSALVSPAPPAAETTATDLDRVRVLLRRGDRGAAREHANRLTRARPLDCEGHLLLGLLDLDVGAPEQALESLRRAAFLDPHSALTHFSLGRAYAQLGDRSRATRALTHARRLLAEADDGQQVNHGGGVLAGELRHAIATQLATLDRPER